MKKVLAGVAVALAMLGGITSTGVAAEQAMKLWSIAVHIEYPDGFIYDHVFASHLTRSEVTSMIQDCGRSHRGGSAVRFHCYPVAE